MCCCWWRTTSQVTEPPWPRSPATWAMPTRPDALAPPRAGTRCRCSMPTTRCGSVRSWATRMIPTASWRGRSTTGAGRLTGRRKSWCCPRTGRVRPSLATRATPCRSICRPTFTSGWPGSPRPAGPACSWWRRQRLPRCSSALARVRIFRWGHLSLGVPMRRWMTWSGSSSTRWCCERIPPAIPPSPNCWHGYARWTWRPTPTRTCRSSNWLRCSTRPGRWLAIRCSR